MSFIMRSAYIFLLITVLHLLHVTYSSSLSGRKIIITTTTRPSTSSPLDRRVGIITTARPLGQDNVTTTTARRPSAGATLDVVLYSIRVANGMNENIYLNCVSGEILLGSGVVGPGQDVRSTFSMNVGETTVYTCDFQWRQKKTTIVVFNGDISGKCGFEYHNYCYWLVSSDGFYFNNKLTPFPHGWNKLYGW